jgi:hypothetical protein
VAGIGGFSGKESSVSAEWLEERIESGQIGWIYTSGAGGVTAGPAGGTPGGAAMPGSSGGATGAPSGGDTRTGSESAIDTVVKSCIKVDSSEIGEGSGTLYRCG